MADLAKFLIGFASVQISSEALQLEEPTGGQRHNEISSGAEVAMDETAFATLSYYCVSEMPGTLRLSGITHATTTTGQQPSQKTRSSTHLMTFADFRMMSKTPYSLAWMFV